MGKKKIIGICAILLFIIECVFPIQVFASIDWEGSKWAKEVKIHPETMGKLTFPTDNPTAGAVNFDVGKAATEANDFWKSKSAEDEDFKEWVETFVNLIKIANPDDEVIDSSGKAWLNVEKDVISQAKKYSVRNR